jgi:hypothetical protein
MRRNGKAVDPTHKGGKAYDSTALRLWLKARGTKAIVPNKSNRPAYCKSRP